MYSVKSASVQFVNPLPSGSHASSNCWITPNQLLSDSSQSTEISISSRLNALGTLISELVIATLHPISSSSLQGTIGISLTISSVV